MDMLEVMKMTLQIIFAVFAEVASTIKEVAESETLDFIAGAATDATGINIQAPKSDKKKIESL